MCVIFNPSAGRGRALRRLKELRHSLGPRALFRPTRGPGHGEEMAFEAASEGFPVIGAAGGDGTVHEVANGLLRAGRADVVLAVYPVGSANDYADSLGLAKNWWLCSDLTAGVRMVDVGLARAETGRQKYFINGLGLGFNGAVTLESRRIQRLQGVALYGLALFRALLFRFACPRMAVRFDEELRQVPTLALTIAIGRREGGFILAPNAVVDDGWFDYLHAGSLRRWELIRYFPRMISGRIPTDHPKLWMGRCRQVTIQSEAPLVAHTDGEFFCRPEEGIRQLDIRILPRALSVQTTSSARTEKA